MYFGLQAGLNGNALPTSHSIDRLAGAQRSQPGHAATEAQHSMPCSVATLRMTVEAPVLLGSPSTKEKKNRNSMLLQAYSLSVMTRRDSKPGVTFALEYGASMRQSRILPLFAIIRIRQAPDAKGTCESRVGSAYYNCPLLLSNTGLTSLVLACSFLGRQSIPRSRTVPD